MRPTRRKWRAFWRGLEVRDARSGVTVRRDGSPPAKAALRLLAGVGIAVVLGTGQPAFGASQGADELFDLGVAFERGGELPEAVAAYRAALDIRPDHLPAIENLAFLLADQGDVPGAVFVLTVAIDRLPDEASLHYHRSLLILRQGEGPDDVAVEGLRRARELGYSKPHLYLLLGRVERLRQAISAAVEFLDLGLAQAPEDMELLREKGLTLAASGDLEASALALSHALRNAPAATDVAADLANVYLRAERPNDALAVLEAYGGSDDLDLVYLLGRAQRALGRPEADATLRRHQQLQSRVQAKREADTRAMVEVNTGIELWGENDLAGAGHAFERALSHRPMWPTARAYLAAAQLEMGDIRGAAELATSILESEPRNAQALMVLGRARVATSPAAGFELLERAVALYPYRVVCLLTLADAYLAGGRRHEAMDLVRRAGEVEPSSAWVVALRRRLEPEGAP